MIVENLTKSGSILTRKYYSRINNHVTRILWQNEIYRSTDETGEYSTKLVTDSDGNYYELVECDERSIEWSGKKYNSFYLMSEDSPFNTFVIYYTDTLEKLKDVYEGLFVNYNFEDDCKNVEYPDDINESSFKQTQKNTNCLLCMTR